MVSWTIFSGGVALVLAGLSIIAVGSVLALIWLSLVCPAIVGSIGLNWSQIWRHLTGQYEVGADWQ